MTLCMEPQTLNPKDSNKVVKSTKQKSTKPGKQHHKHMLQVTTLYKYLHLQNKSLQLYTQSIQALLQCKVCQLLVSSL
jgi:hypothetical protein